MARTGEGTARYRVQGADGLRECPGALSGGDCKGGGEAAFVVAEDVAIPRMAVGHRNRADSVFVLKKETIKHILT